MNNTELTTLAIDFRVDVMFPFFDNIRKVLEYCTLDFLRGIAATSSKRDKFFELITRFEDYFNDWLPYLRRYPNLTCIITSEDFYWNHHARYPDRRLVDPDSQIFNLMSGKDSIGIYSEEPLTVVHNTNHIALSHIIKAGYLDTDKTSPEASMGDSIYCYSEKSGLVADVFGDVIIRLKIKQPWVRVVSYNDTTIKPLGEVLVLDNVPTDRIEIYSVQEYLSKDITFFTAEELFDFFGIMVDSSKDIEECKKKFKIEEERFRYRNEKTNNLYGSCWIKPILEHVVSGSEVEGF